MLVIRRHVISFMVALTVLLPVGGYTVPRVAATINPVYFLISAVAHGVVEPSLPTTGASCVHDCVLKPSDMAKLNSSDIVFYIDDRLESFVRRLDNRAGRRLVKLSDEVTLLTERAVGGRFTHEKDLHIWLDPDNASKMVQKICTVLSEEDPENAHAYRQNAEAALAKIKDMAGRISAVLAPIRDTPYMAEHDAYQYFDRYFGLNFVAALSGSGHTVSVTAKGLSFAKKAAKEHEVRCIFTDPLHSASRYRLVSKKIKICALDPLGRNIRGTDGYFELMETIANSFRSCLQQRGD
ncbi:zinc ABC transporter substrate-binding protein [Anaplasma marginale]|uniref:High-affinity zinc uptake system protein ZnuA n=2 Tax=Anaplasma marginale TaxID=770 RepID=B9KI48_ANAMF|nr:metal ABC transporter substrate-binding protein [Anaplasma marginale]ACM49160.1 high-affinity zinc uptake system protein (znuA) [Anaplasma marginale str. Florida]AXW84830.1 zinc ABC transporter substrate-binding protein [Anaplasma marginale]KAA8473087.1 zinc ABC transporter substrate-binding protein [Anaplasma marginale]KAB0451447.1 zinc ABC transporter substrate-binding protein [Anaplasma marginale]KAB0453400.1 zinc ABC transporter substrate-binding protein [Anaplasma marginale]